MYIRVLSPLTASDGENLALYRWPHEDSSKEIALKDINPRALVLMVHGLGEHAGRYNHVASILRSWGFEVRAYDQRGHGLSGGKPGTLPAPDALLNDLADVVDEVRAQCPDMPLILLGHSLGGLVVSRFVSLKLRPVDGLVMSSPALDASLGVVQKLLLAVLPKVFPNMTVGSGVDAQFISHDARVVAAYQADRSVHDRMSPRLGKFIADAGPAVIAAAAKWRVPTLVMYAGDDKLVNAQGSRRFIEAASKSRKVAPGTVAGKCFDTMYHEIFNELQSTSVFLELKAWLDRKFKKNRPPPH
jgi:alpha-beta hydrolase superfamily lysophospholipase